MARLAQTEGLTDVQVEILKAVREYVDNEILPYATHLEHKDEYPADIVEGLKEAITTGQDSPSGLYKLR